MLSGFTKDNKKTTMNQIRVLSIDPVAVWKWKVKNTNCPICKISLNEAGVGIMSNEPHSNYSIYTTVWESACGHSYHQDCIEKWLKIRQVCPLCNESWGLQEQRVISLTTNL